MRADILPLLAAAARVDLKVAAEAFERARVKALKANGGRDDLRTFLLTVEGFRAAHPLDVTAIDVSVVPPDTSRTTDAPDHSNPYSAR